MYSEAHLAVLAAITGFMLKTSAGFCLCWLISKAIVHPSRRFAIWFAYLVISACYWVFLLSILLFPNAGGILSSQSASLPASSPFHSSIATMQVQPFWSATLSIGIRGLEFAYLFALFCFLSIAVKKRLRLRWILRFTYEPPEEIEALFRPLARNMAAGNVELLMLSGIHSPATVGWTRPVVLLPPVCAERSDQELSDIFRHELQHIRRRDFVLAATAALCRTLLFFHPAAWYARHRLGLESELACDLAVIGDSLEHRAHYAESLLSFARLRVSGEPTPWNVDFAGASTQLNVRIRAILAETRNVPRWMRGLRAASGAPLLLGFIAAAPSLSIVFSWQQPQPANTSLSAPSAQSPVSHGPQDRHIRSRVLAHSPQIPFVSNSAHLPEPPESADESSSEPPPMPRVLASAASDPPLMHRGDSSRKQTAKQPSGIILLSSEPSAANSAARRASIASSITAVASEAMRAAAQEHGKDPR